MAEQRLIDANALDFNYGRRCFSEFEDGFIQGIDEAMEIIKNAPTVDAKPVVHCKDCCCFSYMGSSNRYYCDCYGGYVTDEDYCSRPTPKNSNCGAQMDEEENDNG